MNKQSPRPIACASIRIKFCFRFVSVFTSDTAYPLLYTPDYEREEALLSFYKTLEKKLYFFSLPQDELKQLADACRDIETACIVGFDTETLSADTPEDIYNFCLAAEEKYSAQLAYYEGWLAKNIKDIQLDKPENLLGQISALTKNAGNEFSATLDISGIKNCLAHALNPINGDVFTQSIIIRLVIEVLQPFKSFPLSYPAHLQSVFLESKKKHLNGLLYVNQESLLRKKETQELLQPFVGITVGQLKETDLSQLLQHGYDSIENSLHRTNELLRQLFRKKNKYAEKEPRMRNLQNFLFDSGIECLEPHIGEFNERQQQIIKYLFTKRYLGTKELTLDFRCDRKTIQRDFAKLLSTEVVRSIGNGSALKYCINLKTNAYDILEIYSQPVRKKEEQQESLFGEEIWETKKA